MTICEELQSTEDFAVVFVADTIKEAKGVFFDHQNIFKLPHSVERRKLILNSDSAKSSTSR